MKSMEIAPNIKAEELQALFFDDKALREAPEKLYRMDNRGDRYYFKYDDNQEPQFFISVTSFINKYLRQSDELIRWMAKMGYDEAQRYIQEMAAYGTFLHTQCAELMINKVYDIEDVPNRLLQYIKNENIQPDFYKHCDELQRDILAFAQFMIDVNLQPVAVEMILTHPTDGYAGTEDIAGFMDYEEKGFFGEIYKSGAKKGQPKETKTKRRIFAIIDIKRGRKGFYPAHEIQLAAYREMWNLHFPSLPVEKVFNWSPKEWRQTPSYHLKDQTNSRNAAKLPYLVAQARIDERAKEKSDTYIRGIIDLSKGLNDNIKTMTLSEAVKAKAKELDATDSPIQSDTAEFDKVAPKTTKSAANKKTSKKPPKNAE